MAQDKRCYAYIATKVDLADKAAIAKGFLSRKIADYEAIKSEIDALACEAGDGTHFAQA